MKNPRLASRYAKSLLDLAVEQKQLEPALSDMQYIEAVCRQSPDFANVLRSPVIKGDKKLAIVEAVLGANLNTLSKAFVTLLVNKGREANLPEIAEAFVNQYKVLNNVKTLKLITATAVSEQVKEAIRSKVIASLPAGTQVEVKESIDPELIGGFVLQMDDKLFDASIRRDLNDVKMQFLKNIYVSHFN